MIVAMMVSLLLLWGPFGFQGLMSFSLPIGGSVIIGALEESERYGGQIIEEMEHDYPSLNLHKSPRE